MPTRRITEHNRRAKKTNKAITESFNVFDDRVTVYRTTPSGDVWQFRMYVQDAQRYVRKSLRTRDKEIAYKRAEDEFIFYQSKLRNGEKLFSVTAQELVDKFLKNTDDTLVQTGQMSRGRFSNLKTQLKHYLQFVGKDSKIQNIDSKDFGTYHVFRKKAAVTLTTIRNESITIKSVYRFASENGLIAAAYKPAFPKLKIAKDETKREAYTVPEYRQLTAIGKNWHKEIRNGDYESVFYLR